MENRYLNYDSKFLMKSGKSVFELRFKDFNEKMENRYLNYDSKFLMNKWKIGINNEDCSVLFKDTWYPVMAL